MEKKIIRANDLQSEEAQQILEAIRSGGVDAFVVEEPEGHAVYTLHTADLPYSSLVQRMQQGAAMLNHRGEVIYCNSSLATLLGMANESVVGSSLHDYVEASDRLAYEKLFQDGQNGPAEGELRVCRADVVIPSKFSFTPLSRDKSVVGVLITDLTSEKSYADLARRLQQMQDEERRNIARELHDSVGQLLAAITMNLSQVRKEGLSLTNALNHLLDDNQQMVDQVSREIRTISHLLHPPLLDVAGLASAVRWYVDGFSERSQIKVALQIPPDFGRLPSQVEITVFRVVQECLTNVYRHSGSSQCWITMKRDSKQLRIEIKDNGKGIPKAAKVGIPSSSGLGLRGMRERIRQLNGTLRLDSDDQGTTVTVTLPTPNRASQPSKGALPSIA